MHLRDLAPASFRGVPFLVPSDKLEEGRQGIEHLYPDANYRYVEDNGLIPPTFKITAILHGQGLPGKLSALRNALTQPGPGTLKHPYIGAQFVAVLGSYTINRDDSDSGVITLDITFAVTGPPIFPGLVSGVAAVVSGLAKSNIQTMFEEFASVYGDGGSSPVSRDTIASAIESIATPLDAAFGNSPARTIVQEAEGLAQNPDRLAELMEKAFIDALEDDVASADQVVSGMRSVSDAAVAVGALADAVVDLTAEYGARRQAMTTLSVYAQAAAFGVLADGIAARTHKTAEAVEIDENDLVARYERLQARDIAATLHRRLAEIRIATSDVLKTKQARLPNVVAFDAVLVPASVLTYSLYESDARLQDIVDLNAGVDRPKNPMLYNGLVDVFAVV